VVDARANMQGAINELEIQQQQSPFNGEYGEVGNRDTLLRLLGMEGG